MLLVYVFSVFVIANFVCAEEMLMMERLMSHHSCRLDRDCHENSFCIGNDIVSAGFCRCEDGFIISRNRTFYECLLPATTVGSNCTRDLQCTFTLGNPSSCVEGTCQCNANAHLAPNNQCYIISRPGEICNVDYNCLLSDNTIGTCTVGRCRCPVHHHHTAEGRCMLTSRMGENCTEHDNCRHTFAICQGVCRCLAGYVVSENGRRCLSGATEFDQPCEELAQCSTYLADSFCNNGTCTCHPGHHPLGPRCWRSVVAGGRCIDRRNCFLNSGVEEGVDCIEGICTCLDEFERDRRGDCVRRSSAPVSATVSYFVFFTNFFVLLTLLFSNR